ncbi:PepSY domain-containing protein [Bradyrhizobium sp. 83012]|uniref:PepSY domain-containing protein n=1 Tax=Bradyrhizobium aeschynomenes TaxID=2734909 RepID=A0ABX2CEE4_9BRAD|nr:PepSY-associated TM helix domain-containing protein [Bradyrhizobium aeschynomenes]NPU09666.1 PepSY domain-containing protein [Bradyrhizobium aeschynomenes]NPU65840.1 PepSY domain-containing protein [Bradyrhizobium aeschynomenes]NPV20990.1 PepSY domain-containing protein [Bradyrhizobium aeschynomenes]
MTALRIKPALLQLHSIVGLTAALILSLIGLTGAIMSFEDEIQAGLNAALAHVAPRAEAPLAPAALIARLQADPDIGKVSAITLSRDPAAAVRVRFARNTDGGRPSSLLVDPYDGRVLGEPRGEEFFATVRRLHRWLLLPGDGNGAGRQITGAAALGLVVLLITGVVLRWPRRATSAKAWLKPQFGLGGRGLHRSLHSVVGTWVLPVYLIMALTGLSYSYAWYKDGLTWLLAPAATPMPGKAARGRSEADTQAKPLALDLVWATLRDQVGDRFAVMQLTLPAGAGTMVRVRTWPSEGHDGRRDEFRIDGTTGRLTTAERYADGTFGERVLARILDIHRGSILGWPGQLLFMLAAALMPLFAVTGVLLYLSRRRLRRRAPQPTVQLVPGE